MQFELEIQTQGRALYLITHEITQHLSNLPNAGLLNLFVRHTSCSLTIQENADPSAKEDLEEFLNRLIPDGQNWHRHTAEGKDDTTSHMKSTLTATSLNIPIYNHKLALGIWQGIYLWEHRLAPHRRRVLGTIVPI